jgi:hypothetical protein
LALATLTAMSSAVAQNAIPDLRGTWKGDSESIVLDGGNAHHPVTAASERELRSVCLYADDRQAGWAPLLRDFFIGARRLESCRRDVA